MMKIVCILLLVAVLSISEAGRTVDHHLSTLDQTRLEKVFEDGIKSNDIQSFYYSIINMKQSNAEKQSLCKKLSELYTESKLNDFEKNFYYSSGHKHLGCSTTFPANIINTIKTSLAKESSTSQEIYYNYLAAEAVSATIDDGVKSKISKNLQSVLKNDDSLSSLGHGFLIASELGQAGSFAVDRVEDAIVQADEVDGKMLQFEGGLSITALIVNGALKLTASQKKPVPLTEDQGVKFATYFLSRRSVQTPKGAHILLEVLNTIAQLKSIAPITIDLIGNGQLSPEKSILSVKVSNVLGAPLVPTLAVISTTITSKQTNQVLVSKVNLVPSASDKTVYTLDLSIYKPTRGIYTVDILSGVYNQKLTIKFLGKIKVNSLEIGVGDSDSSSQLKKQNVIFPNKLQEIFNADSQMKVVLKVLLVDEDTGKPITVHQAFVRFATKNSMDEIIFVAEQDTSKAYKFDMDVGARSGDFNYNSDLYTIELIVGDASISNSFKWHLADIQLKFNQEFNKKDTDNNHSIQQRVPRPEIVHKFREPESRPPRFFSDLFSVLCLLPLLILLVLWMKLRVNISNLPCSLSALGFHLGFGAILGLFGLFWLQLNMFDTIRLLLPLALFTFLCGNRLLRSIAARKLEK